MASTTTPRPRSRARVGKSMATTEKVFRDLLCEGRSLPAETSDPAGARTIDELRKQVKDLKAELEADRVKTRELVRDHEKELRTLREESERKLETTVESVTVRKDQERAAEMKRVEERLEKQRESELRMSAKDHADEIRRLQRKWQHEKEEGIRLAVEEERRHYSEEFLHVLPEEEVVAREARLTKELFVLGEQNERLEEQVRHLTRENRTQIDLLRRMKHEYSLEVESVVKQNKIEASREMAQLQLAERIIAEKEHELHEVGARADQFMIEKEFLEEELATVRTSMNVSSISHDLNVATPSSPPPTTRRSMGGASGVMQKRLEELEAVVKKLEEEKAEMKQENASLRKKIVQQQSSVPTASSSEGKASQESLVKLRKRNADLMTLTKKLDERCTALKAENEQLRKQDSSPQDLEQQVRKAVARQHTKNLQEYMKQIHSKDKELSELKRKLAKFEVASPSRSDSSPELEKKIRSMALEKLRMEKLVTKLYAKLPDSMEDVGVSNSELQAESHHADQLAEENAALKSQLEELQQQISGGEEVDSPASLKQQVEQLETSCRSLRQSKEALQGEKGELEQRCHELSQKLKVTELAVKELEGASGQCSLLEGQLKQVNTQLTESERKANQLQGQVDHLTSSLKEKEGAMELLEVDRGNLEVKVHNRDSEIQSLRVMLKEVQATPTKTDTMETSAQTMSPKREAVDAGVQTEAALFTERSKVGSSVATSKQLKAEPSPRQHHQAKSPARADLARVKGGHRTSACYDYSNRSLHQPQDTSLESEMRVAGVEVADPYDSSEGVGFSDSNLDEVPGSTHSLESFKSDKLKDEALLKTKNAVSAVPVASLAVNQQPSSVAVERSTAEGVASVNLDLQEEEDSSSDECMSSSSESDLSPHKHEDSAMIDGQKVGVASSEPGVFIVKYSYDPSVMSPNPNHDQELTLVAGDYIYVFGEMDGDGFYRAQLTTGEEGLVPSNFIEMVEDDGDEENTVPPPKPSRRRPSSQLHDITEEEEEVSSSSKPLAPPKNLELDRQFVEGDAYSVTLKWAPPSPCPSHAIGYNIYVNGELMSHVEGAEQSSVIVSGVPRKQLVKIAVCTASQEGESPATPNPIVLNPQYPDPPGNMDVSETDKSLLVSWDHKPSLPEGNAATGFVVYVNGKKCVEVASSLSPSTTSQCVEILANDIRRLEEELTIQSSVYLTVRALAGHHESRDSPAVLLSRKQLSLLLSQHSQMLGSEESSSSEVSVASTSSEEEKKTYSPAKVENDERHVTSSNDHMMTVVDHVTNGIEEESNQGSQGPPRYYRALYDYDPFYHSPNEEDVEEELGFKAGDIITAHSEVGEDGFLEGELRGKVGFVPSNMLEEITEVEELAQIATLIRSQNSVNGRGHFSAGGEGSVTKMRAVYDYDPAQDSPNTESGSEVELAFTEGDILTVFGKPDEDGFFQAELAGKKGLAPSNFLEEMSIHCNDRGVEVFAADEEALRRAEEIIQKASKTREGEAGRKGSILSRGKELLSLGKKHS